jgi:predicted PurR-regulated permease PerM
MARSPRPQSFGFLLIFVILLVGLLSWLFWPFLTPIAWALLLSRLFCEPHERLASLLSGRRSVSAMILTLGIMAVIVLPLSYVSAVAVDELTHLYGEARDWIQGGGLAQIPRQMAKLPLIGLVSQEVLGRLIVAYGPIEPSGSVAQSLAGTAGDVVKQVAERLTDFLLTLFTLFFLFRDGPSLCHTVYSAIPLDGRVKREIIDCLDHAIVALIRGTLLTAVAQGAVAGLTYWLLDLPVPLLLGALSALVSLLPMGGTALIWGPLVVYLLVTGAVWKGLILLTVGAGIVGLMDNLLQPWLVGQGIQLPLILVFFASLGGMAYFGFIGLFVGPIILALTKASIHLVMRMYQPSLSPQSRHAIGAPKRIAT